MTCRDSLVQNIVEPFGLRGLFTKRDQHGGRVLTRRNAKRKFDGLDNKIYEPEDAKYEEEDYRLESKVREQMLAANALGGGKVKDKCTGEAIPKDNADVDHVVSKRAFHAEGGFMLDQDQRSAFANDPGNLTVTDKGVNRSKGSGSIARAKERRPQVDGRRTRPVEQQAKETVAKHAPSKAHAAAYYGKKVTPEAVGSGLRLGFRLDPIP